MHEHAGGYSYMSFYKQLKLQIIEIGLKLLDEGFVRDTQGNISIFSENDGMIVITPAGIPYRKRREEDILIVDITGRLVEGCRRPTSEIALHLELYKRRKDIRAVIHTHPIYCCVFSIIHEAIPQVMSEVTMGFNGWVPFAPYAKPGTQEVTELACKAMGEQHYACLLANHGLVTAGKNIEDVYRMTVAIEDAAHMIIMARSMGAKEITVPSNH